MHQNLSKLGKPLANIWGRLGASQRISVAAGTLVLMAGLAAISLWPSHPDSGRFYGGRSAAEASMVTAALAAYHTQMEVISQNIANANTTQDENGQPYQRRVVILESVVDGALEHGQANPPVMQVARVQRDSRPPLRVYAPGHPLADEHGMVALPNINIHEEMVDLVSATHRFEANLALIKNARTLALKPLAKGRP